MTEKAVERLKAKLLRQTRKGTAEGRWYWHGTEFITHGWYGVQGSGVPITFYATLSSVKVELEIKEQYGIDNKIQVFKGENAMAEAVEWTAEQLLDLHIILTERVSPYIEGYNNYLKALRGEE